MNRNQQLRRAAGILGLAALGAALLTGCADTSDQSRVYWKRSETKPIVALDSTQSLYLRGSYLSADGGSKIDYRYAEKTQDGAIREGLISTLLNDPDDSYGRNLSYTVSVYEDATAKTARVDIYSCKVKKAEDGSEIRDFFFEPSCTDGGSKGKRVDRLVDLHVPRGTVQQDFSDDGGSLPSDGSTEESEEGSGDGSSSR